MCRERCPARTRVSWSVWTPENLSLSSLHLTELLIGWAREPNDEKYLANEDRMSCAPAEAVVEMFLSNRWNKVVREAGQGSSLPSPANTPVQTKRRRSESESMMQNASPSQKRMKNENRGVSDQNSYLNAWSHYEYQT